MLFLLFSNEQTSPGVRASEEHAEKDQIIGDDCCILPKGSQSARRVIKHGLLVVTGNLLLSRSAALAIGGLSFVYEIPAGPCVQGAAREEDCILLAPTHLAGEGLHNK